MNLALLKEARAMLKADMSYTDVSNSLAISKANLLLMLRIEDIVRADYDDVNLYIQSLESDLQSLNKKNKNLQKNVDSVEFGNFLDLQNDYEILKKDFKALERKNNNLEDKFYKLENEFYLIPNFVRNLFLRNEKS